DVVVPAHSGLAQTLACLDSLEAANPDRRYEVVVVNDCSPESELAERLHERAAAGRITLLENPRNLGFVASANRGLRLHPERDVILLNSDTVVPLQWAERLRRVAYGNGAIGTVTPLSNNATICSFPRPNADNLLPVGWTLEELDSAFHHANGDGCHDLPTAVGYCMYIKRQLMDEIGYLDEHEWGKGYAEENDFCLRAAALGWRNVSADGLFVLHHGSVSFGGDKSPLLAENLAKLYRRYPDYPATVQRFVTDDPLAEARNPVVKQLLLRHARRYLLFVSHELGGGTQVAIDDLCRGLAEEGHAVLELRSQLDGKWRLQAHGTDFAATYRPDDLEWLVAELRELGIWHIHFHQIPFFPRRITELPQRLGIPYDVTVHDYLPLCPRINMMDETGFYCGDSQYDPATCNRCIAALGPEEGVERLYAEHGEDVAAWRSHHREFLGAARRVFLPSNAVAQLLKPHMSLANAVVRPHPEAPFRRKPAATPPDAVVRVAVIGAIGAHKGFDLLLACARTASKDGLPLQFVVVGYTQDDAAFDRLDNVTLTGPYRREELDALLPRQGCQVAAFFSPWPETYCYALTEAWRAGLYPVALDLGAPAERIRAAAYGDVLPVNADPKRINRALLDAVQRAGQRSKPVTIGKAYGSMLADYYGLEAPPGAPAPGRRRAPATRVRS
ncbi:MAG: glycosyltransferase, partial [Methylococcaceae bacterium]|nr:glycosyltransferase [Methylococcaceae bacterium]